MKKTIPLVVFTLCSQLVFAHEIQQCEIDLIPPAPEQSGQRTYEATTLGSARSGFLTRYGTVALDCDPVRGLWQCSDTQIGSGSPAGTPLSSTTQTTDNTTTDQPTGFYKSGDLISVHHDFFPDPDDFQAVIANREILDDYSVDHMVVSGAIGHDYSTPLSGSYQHTLSLFPDALDAQVEVTALRVATAWGLTLNAGNDVWVAEGGPSDFTADVIRELKRRNVGNLKRIHIVQHTPGGFNEVKTSASNLSLVKGAAQWTPINNGNRTNNTPNFNSGINDSSFRSRALNSQYGAQWGHAFSRLGNKVDFSDAVELMYILGIPKTAAANPVAFAERYF